MSPLVNLGSLLVSQIQSELGVNIIKTRMNGRFRIGVVGEEKLGSRKLGVMTKKSVCLGFMAFDSRL